jgi:hypothetical protein
LVDVLQHWFLIVCSENVSTKIYLSQAAFGLFYRITGGFLNAFPGSKLPLSLCIDTERIFMESFQQKGINNFWKLAANAEYTEITIST